MKNSYLACIGLGIEQYDGINNEITFNAIQELQNAIKLSLEGKFGNQIIGGKKHARINATVLMQQMWFFGLQKVYRRIVYPESIKEAQNLTQVSRIIQNYRKNL